VILNQVMRMSAVDYESVFVDVDWRFSDLWTIPFAEMEAATIQAEEYSNGLTKGMRQLTTMGCGDLLLMAGDIAERTKSSSNILYKGEGPFWEDSDISVARPCWTHLSDDEWRLFRNDVIGCDMVLTLRLWPTTNDVKGCLKAKLKALTLLWHGPSPQRPLGHSL
jgi:hypothetical protein